MPKFCDRETFPSREVFSRGRRARRRPARGFHTRVPGILLSLLISICPGGSAWAGLGEWSGGEGPRTDRVEAIAVDPFDSRHLLTVGPSGLQASRDGGTTWTVSGLGSETATTVVFHPARRGVIYVGANHELYRSSDGGGSWEVSDMPAGVLDIAIDPLDADRIYATLNSNCGVCGPSFAQVSDDGGETWGPIAQGTSGTLYFELAIDPTDNDVLYIATSAAVWKSTDRGVSWTDVTPPTSVRRWFDALLVTDTVAEASSAVYAGGGEGVFRSLDGGATWIQTGDGPLWVRELRATADGALFAVSARGIHRSTDDGTTWVAIRPSAGSIDALDLAIDRRTPGVVYAGARGDGLIRSVDGGESWTKVSTDTEFIAYTNRLVAAPGVPATLYAAASGRGVLRSLDGGRTWEARSTGLAVDVVEALVVAPGNPKRLYAGTSLGVFRSDDGGGQWSARPFGLSNLDPMYSEVDAVAVDPRDTAHVFAAGRNGVYRSFDGGATWAQLLDLSATESTFAIDIDIDPHDPDHLVALSRRDVWQSFDGGATWTELEEVENHTSQLTSWTWDPQQPGVAWLTGAGGVFKTSDGGTSFLYANDGLCEPSCGLPREVVWVAPDRIYARDPNALWLSRNGGLSWEFFDTGGLSSSTLVAHPWSPGTLYLGGFGGVYNHTALDCDSETALCLQDRRFQLEIGWRDFENRRGHARFAPFASDTSTVGWFFTPDNWEVLAKVVDGGDLDGHHWVFAGVASNVETVVRVTDTVTGRARSYHSPLGQTPETLAEIGVFPVDAPAADPVAVIEEVVAVAQTPAPTLSSGFDPTVVGQACVTTVRRACLGEGRFGVEVGWADFLGRTGHARRVAEGTDDSSLWWFFGVDNWELLLKVLDGCATNGHHWVFAAGTTNLGLSLQVTDYTTGEQLELTTEVGQPMPTVTEIEALGGC